MNPNQYPNQPNPANRYPENRPAPRRQSGFAYFMKRLLVFIIVVLIIGGGLYAFVWYKGNANKQATVADPNASAYSAVFLNNGQVYFGRIGDISNGYLTLNDVFYVSGANSTQNQNSASGTTISIVKLGSEVHGPTDAMYINNSNILFYESLRYDSKIVKSIQDYITKTTQ